MRLVVRVVKNFLAGLITSVRFTSDCEKTSNKYFLLEQSSCDSLLNIRAENKDTDLHHKNAFTDRESNKRLKSEYNMFVCPFCLTELDSSCIAFISLLGISQ